MAASIPSKSGYKEIYSIEKSIPLCVDELQKKISSLAAAINKTLIPSQLVSELQDLSNQVRLLKIEELTSSKESSKETVNEKFLNTNEKMNYIYYKIKRYVEEEELDVADSLIEFINEIEKFDSKLTAELFSCIKLIISEKARINVAVAFFSKHPKIDKTNFDVYKLSEEGKLKFIKKILEKNAVTSFDSKILNFSDPSQKITILSSLSKKEPLKFIEFCNSLKITDRKELLKLAKEMISTNKNFLSNIWHKNFVIFFNSDEQSELAKFYLNKHGFEKIFEKDSEGNQTKDAYLKIILSAFSYKITGKIINRYIKDNSTLISGYDNELIIPLRKFEDREFIINIALASFVNIRNHSSKQLLEFLTQILQPEEFISVIQNGSKFNIYGFSKLITDNEPLISLTELYNKFPDPFKMAIKNKPELIRLCDELKPEEYLALAKIAISEIKNKPEIIGKTCLSILNWVTKNPKIQKEHHEFFYEIAKLSSFYEKDTIHSINWFPDELYYDISKIIVTTYPSKLLELNQKKISPEKLLALFKIAYENVAVKPAELISNLSSLLKFTTEQQDPIVQEKMHSIIQESLKSLIQKFPYAIKAIPYKDERFIPLFEIIFNEDFLKVMGDNENLNLTDSDLKDILNELINSGKYKKEYSKTILQIAKKQIMIFPERFAHWFSLCSDDDQQELITFIMQQNSLLLFMDNVDLILKASHSIKTIISLIRASSEFIPVIAEHFEITLNSDILKTKYRGFLFLLDPMQVLENRKSKIFAPEDPLFELFSSEMKKFESLSEEERKEPPISLISTLKWIGYYNLQVEILEIPLTEQSANASVLKQIYETQNPSLRSSLTEVFLDNMAEIPKIESESKELIKPKEIFKFSKKGTELFQMLLTPLFRSSEENLTPIIKLFSQPKYASGSAKTIVLRFLIKINNDNSLTIKEKGNLCFFILNNLADRKSEDVLQILANIESIISLQDSKKLISLMENPQKDFQKAINNIILDIFQSITGLTLKDLPIEGVLKLMNDPGYFSDILAYFSQLEQLPLSDKEKTITSLKEYVVGVISENFPKLRYKTKDAIRSTISEKEWITGAQASIEELIKEKEIDPKQTFNLKKELYRRVMDDKHFDAFDKSPDKPSYLKLFLKDVDVAITVKNNLQNELRKIAEQLPNCKKESEESVELLKQRIYLRVQMQIIEFLESNTEKNLLKCIDTVSKYLTNLPQIKADLEYLLKNLEEQNKTKTSSDLKELYIIDTDDGKDLLRCGTDVVGSCQKIHGGDPGYNKCLLGYIMDGNIRMLAVKNDKGRIIARKIFRLLRNQSNREPVLLLERLYVNPGTPQEAIQALDEMALQRARALNLPLLSDKRDKDLKPYSDSVESIGSPAPFVYVDTASLGVTKGKYTIRSTSLSVIWEPKTTKKIAKVDYKLTSLSAIRKKLTG